MKLKLFETQIDLANGCTSTRKSADQRTLLEQTMSYSVKYSTTNATAELSPLDKSLRSVPSVESLQTINKVCRNIHSKPEEAKFRRLRLSNGKIKALLVDVPGCIEALHELGWTVSGENHDFLEFEGKMDFKHVRAIEGAIDVVTREAEKKMIRKVAGKKA